MKQYTLKTINTQYQESFIKIAENDLIRIYSLYKKEELKENIENIIKVHIPIDKEEAKNMLNNGFTYKDKKYISLITTVNMMKHEDREQEYSMEYFFISEEDKDFIEYLEDLSSLGKLKIKQKEEEVLCINKDVVSRLSLLTSAGDRVYLPCLKKAILPEMTYTYINNYLQFKKEFGMNRPSKSLKLEKHEALEVAHTAMDGSGFIMPNIMKNIQKQLGVRYSLSWVGIREIGVASKGLLVKFDFKKYLREEHGLTSLIVKDMWGNDVNLFDVDVIQNASQVKWGKWFDSAEEIEKLKLNYPHAGRLLNGFNICKYNKETPKSYTKANYQIITNLALTPSELEEISKEHKDIYRRVINREEHATRIMLGDISRDEEKELSASTKVHRLIQLDNKMLTLKSSYKVIESLVNKSVHTFAGGSIYVKGNYKVVIKDAISYFDSLINAEYTEDGKIKGYMSLNGLQDNQNYVPREKGHRTLARCPLNSATELIKTTLVENPLYEKYFKELSSDIMFYPFNDFMMRQSGEDEDLDISLAIDNEIIYNAVIEDVDENGVNWYFRNQFDGGSHKVKYTKENMIEILLQVRGNVIGQLSNKGAIVSNLIQEMPYKFLREDEIVYISLSQFRSEIEKKINAQFLSEKEYLYSTYTGEELQSEKKRLENKINKKINNEMNVKRELIKELQEEGVCWDYTQLTEEEIKNFIMKNFEHYKKYSYYLLYLQMVAIDQPKTNIKVEKAMEKPLYKAIGRKAKKPSYIYHAKYKEASQTVKYTDCRSSNTLLCNFAKDINNELGKKARLMDKDIYNNEPLFRVLKKVDAVANEECTDTLRILEDKYHVLRNEIKEKIELKQAKELREKLGHYKELKDLEIKINETYYNKKIATASKKSKLKNLYNQKEKLEAEREENREELLDLETKIAKLNAKITEEFNKIDLKIAENYKELIQDKYSDKVILKSITKVRRETEGNNLIKASSRFIINFCFAELEKELIAQKNGVGTMYKEDLNGEIKYLNTNYSIINVDLKELDLDKKEQLNKKCKLGELRKIRANYNGQAITKSLKIDRDEKNMYLIAEERIGFVFPDFRAILEGIEEIEVKEIEVAKNNKSITIYY
ncbi:hypothetical protein [Clostridium thermobutyricum]|uniref:hypothetical protein n=1 Tax=Clostridium thermobutyricum TaxID=29372 RepID=UPI0018ABA7AB|nr:hypothetical protein [Clostridium thermobutyricum]